MKITYTSYLGGLIETQSEEEYGKYPIRKIRLFKKIILGGNEK